MSSCVLYNNVFIEFPEWFVFSMDGMQLCIFHLLERKCLSLGYLPYDAVDSVDAKVSSNDTEIESFFCFDIVYHATAFLVLNFCLVKFN